MCALLGPFHSGRLAHEQTLRLPGIAFVPRTPWPVRRVTTVTARIFHSDLMDWMACRLTSTGGSLEARLLVVRRRCDSPTILLRRPRDRAQKTTQVPLPTYKIWSR